MSIFNNKRIAKTDKKLVYYGPHPCQECDKDGAKGTLVVKAGNGAPKNLVFNYPKEGVPYPNYFWKKHNHIK